MKRDDLALILGKRVREARKALGLTQERTADLLDVSAEYYGRLERGAVRPSLGMFARMVALLGVRADVLLGFDAEPAVKLNPLTRPDDSPQLKAIVAMLRNADPGELCLVRLFLRQLASGKLRPADLDGAPPANQAHG